MKTCTVLFGCSVALLATISGCANPGPTPSRGFEPAAGDRATTPITAAMLRHYDRARALTSAAIFGDGEGAGEAARAILAEGPLESLPSSLEAEREAFRSSVEDVGGAGNGGALAGAAAEVARRCGDCHLAAGLGPTFSVGRIADPVTPEDHIRVLAWGSSRMWEGMVAASELSWRAGARAVSGQLLREDLYVSRIANPTEGRAFAARLQALGVEALAVSNRADQARVLGEIWGTCSGCHAMIDSGG